MEDKPELYLKKLTKEEKEQMREENRKNGKPKILIVMIVIMIAIMVGMFIISYYWSMNKLPGKMAAAVMIVCLVVEVVLCETTNKINHRLYK